MLLPNGRQEGYLWKCGGVDGEPGKSLQVCIGGQFVGRYKDWAADEYHGDLLDLWAATRGLTPMEARLQAMAYLGITQGNMVLEKREYAKPGLIGSTPPAENGKVMNYLCGERKLEASIVHRYRVEGLQDGGWIIYPCFSPKDELVNRCYIGLTRGEDGKKRVKQDKGCAPCLFGWQSFSPEDYKKGYVVLTEGQIDAMTWRQWGHPALSIPNGAGMTWLDYNFEDLAIFDTIYLSFDMDGKVNVKEASKRLGLDRCRLVRLPHKDANDCLKALLGPAEAQQWLDLSEYQKPQSIVTALELKDAFEAYMATGDAPTGITHECFHASWMDKFYIRPGELTIWAGISGHGKSTFLRWLFMQLMMQYEPVGIASMEVKAVKSMKGMYLSLKKHTPIDSSAFCDAIGNLAVFYNRMGMAFREELLEGIVYCAKRYGVKHFMIDSLMRVDGLEEDYPAQGMFMNQLQGIAKDYDIHIHLVAHEGKGSEHEAPSGDRVKGSSLLRNNCDNLIFIRRNMDKRNNLRDGKITYEEASKLPDTILYIEKDREGGVVGKVELRFDRATETFSRFKPLVHEADFVPHRVNGAAHGARVLGSPKAARFSVDGDNEE